MNTTTAKATGDVATRSVAAQGMHPLFHELFIAPGNGESGPRRRAGVRKAAVRTVRHGTAAAQDRQAWA